MYAIRSYYGPSVLSSFFRISTASMLRSISSARSSGFMSWRCSSPSPMDRNRITSYNVCYTKLLRFPQHTSNNRAVRPTQGEICPLSTALSETARALMSLMRSLCPQCLATGRMLVLKCQGLIPSSSAAAAGGSSDRLVV